MRWISSHVACSRWAIGGALLGLSFAAYAQDQLPAALASDPSTEMWLRLVQTVGLPGVVAWIAWQLRGVLTGGITVRLSDEDRELLRKPAGKV